MKPRDDELQAFSSVPVNEHLGFRLLSRSREEVTVSMEVRPEFLQEGGVMHGGLISAVADTAAVYLFCPNWGAGESITSIEFKVNFLRPALVDNGPVIARARPVRRGTRIGLADVTVSQGEDVVATGTFTYLLKSAKR